MDKKDELKLFDLDRSLEDDEILTAVKQLKVDDEKPENKEISLTDSSERSAMSEEIQNFIKEVMKNFGDAPALPECLKFCSRRACRFEVPADLRKLQNCSPVVYLQNYCIVEKNKALIYKKYFELFENDAYIKSHRLLDVFSNIFGRRITEDEKIKFYKLLDLNPEVNVKRDMFIILAAFMERILSSNFKNGRFGDERNYIERLEFDSLISKLDVVEMPLNLWNLLCFVQNS
ncbi:uncharacterized protein LOC111623965 isoform X2 [Centruroides sculpturatus]|nr:uncharacterized protein LOC111623965 isoform X2 [Centruroides sculpturatus]